VFDAIRYHEWSEDHIAKHGVTWEEVEDAVLGRPCLQQPSKNGTYKIFGTTRAGRYLAVLVADDGDGQCFIVTAREMTAGEQRTFRRRI
jgi:uncharacterized DUF497 family protein